MELRALREQPFELFLELERRSKAAVAGRAGAAAGTEEWVGIAFRLGGDLFIAPRAEVREVLMYPHATTRVPGAKAWINGIANVRGYLLPVVDVKVLLGGGQVNPDRATRLLVVNHREIPAGLVVDEVLGFRRFSTTSLTM